MTFQEAQIRFSEIVGGLSLALSADGLSQKRDELLALAVSLPPNPAFDPIAAAIQEFSPKLSAQLTQAVLNDLQSRDASFKETSDRLTQVADKAQADARVF